MAAAPEDGATVDPLPGALVAEKYRVGPSLGRGGMGHVVAATHIDTGKEVALKWILDPGASDRMERFSREARALGRIRHPNVVDVYDVVEHEGRPCLVMERVHGESLVALLTREPHLEVARALDLAIEIGRGVAAAHECGVIHRDLKPANVLLRSDGGRVSVKVIDFGISKLAADAQPLTVAGAMLGTPRYVAPEQARDSSSIDARVDVYALGAILYEMLAGRPPHQHPDPNALLLQIMTVAPRPLALVRDEVSRSLSDIVDRTLAKDPDARIPTMDALVALLRQARSSADLALSETLVDGAGALDVETLAPKPAAAPPREVDTVPDARAHAPTLLDTRPRASLTPQPTPPRDRRHVWLIVAGLVVVVWLGITLFRGDPDTSVDQAIIDHAGVDQTTIDRAGVDHAGVEHAGVEHAVVEHAVVDHAVVDQAAMDQALIDHAVVDHSAVEHAATDHAVVDHAAADHAVVDHAPADHSVADHSVADHSVVAAVGEGPPGSSGSASSREAAPRPDHAQSARRADRAEVPPSTAPVVPPEAETTTPPATTSRGGFALEPW